MTINVGSRGSAVKSIDTVLAINAAGTQYSNLPDVWVNGAETWFKTGVTSEDLATYPSAAQTTETGPQATGLSFNVTFGQNSLVGNATYFYGLRGGGDIIEYDLTGTRTFASYGYVPSSSKGALWDGTDFWVLTFSNQLVQFSSAWVQGSTLSPTLTGSNFKGATWDGTHFWVIDSSGLAEQVTAAGVATGTTIQFPGTVGGGAGTSCFGIVFAGGNLYAMASDGATTDLTQATSAGLTGSVTVLTGYYTLIGSFDSDGLAVKNGGNTVEIYSTGEFTYVGQNAASFADTDSNIPEYKRVK